jgi:hypothetical protein
MIGINAKTRNMSLDWLLEQYPECTDMKEVDKMKLLAWIRSYKDSTGKNITSTIIAEQIEKMAA